MGLRKSLLSIFGIEPLRIGSGESYIRELSRALDARGWNHIVGMATSLPPNVYEFLDAPNVCFEVIERPWEITRNQFRQVSAILKRHRPQILHLHYTSFLGPYPWLAKFRGVKRVYITDHTSRPEGHVIKKRSVWKRGIADVINYPLTGLVCVSDYGCRCMVDSGSIPARLLTPKPGQLLEAAPTDLVSQG